MELKKTKAIWGRLIFLLIFSWGALGLSAQVYGGSNADDYVPVSVVGVHHLGEDYLIHRFWINKKIGDNIGEEGGGGSLVCCVSLPRKWSSTLIADVRWKVYRIIRTHDSSEQESVKLEGMYQAQVPIEPYDEVGDFYVHFFSNGRVRIVVSPVTASGDQHPIRKGRPEAILQSTSGRAISEIFTKEELAEIQRQINRDKKKYGDWR